MTERACPYCGDPMSNPRRVQCGKLECARLHHNKRTRPYVAAYRAKQVADGTYKHWTCERTCVECGAEFETTKPDAKYCSTGKDSCEASARSVEYKRRTLDPTTLQGRRAQQARERRLTDEGEALLASITGDPTRGEIAAYRRALKGDPCAYCGESAPTGIDHIEPVAVRADRSDWTNLTGCCKRCNETKRDLSLLVALPWIPVSRQYHDERRLIFAKAA